ncbi:alpha/beta hydrolase fold domain-containing protein [Rhizobium sp. SSA_523]|uniref:alpha/beta hydrolase fold domain-containing protein n=1 Tax=Rhizobium sp. SSA_523 TaxID=2952477 RepID=UPI0020910656|nr:alpha/beta hydrolase fold domain-containing protein [Rhizobium sp. SSA_523]MCO5732501.1 alpha/beta hydrolase [Rhizobium sp. SSA_523]WKC22359.1 alpha/beta hydrolase fold domain-containing protein [Rhizobium sp. SSA_523]
MTQWDTIDAIGAAKPSVPLRRYESAGVKRVPPIVLYLRGRAFLDRDRGETERPIAKALAQAGAVVLEADYTKASRNVFPQAMECAFEALAYLSHRRSEVANAKSPLFVAGDEAGGNIAAGVALKARDLLPGKLSGQMLFSPMIDPQMATVSFRSADALGMREAWSDGWSHYLGSFLQHPYAAPCLCSRLANLPPALLVTSEDDPLRDEVMGYSSRLKTCGVEVRNYVFAAEAGWTSIYREGTGAWLPALCNEFNTFVETVQ